MLTEFGKELRRLRLNLGELLRDMADKLGVTSAYLSAVENGKKKATLALYKQVVEVYQLSPQEAAQLKESFDRSSSEIRLNTRELSDERQDLAVIFARRISELDSNDLEEIKKILSK